MKLIDVSGTERGNTKKVKLISLKQKISRWIFGDLYDAYTVSYVYLTSVASPELTWYGMIKMIGLQTPTVFSLAERNQCCYWVYVRLMRLGRLKYVQLIQVPVKLRLILFVRCVLLALWFKQGDSLLFLLFTFALNMPLEVSKQNRVPHPVHEISC
jgi:hypothetical protein